MLKYFNPLEIGHGKKISIDNIVLDNKINNPAMREAFVNLLEALPFEYHVELRHWESFKIGTFRNQFTVTFEDGSSFWIGMGLNESKTNWGRVRLDFNPNKLALHSAFRDVLAFLNTHSLEMNREIKRYDLAIDLPVSREDVFLIKDNRLYSERRHGAEWTQYLGKKSHVGHVKLYNKQVEINLTNPLTRLELTLDSDEKYEDINWPTVYYINQMQMSFDEMKLTATNRFILTSLLRDREGLTQLGRRVRLNMEKLLKDYVDEVHIGLKQYNAIREQLRAYKKYPQIPLDTQNLESDKPVIVSDKGKTFVEIKGATGLPFTDMGCLS